MKIGVFGSAFDPITLGHMVTMEMISDRRGFDFILLLLSSDKRIDKSRQLTANFHRLNMVKLAIDGQRKFKIETVEMNAAGWETYTYYTMKKLAKKYPNDELYFLMGADNLANISSWKYGKELIESNRFVVMGREGYDMAEMIAQDSLLTKYEHHFDCLSKGVKVETSSSFIRSRLKDGLSVKYLVPEKALQYALAHGLYKE
ncbi:nicotinate (nicotinamide) nucleotide adenylyltransferase [Bacillus aquiflavi]|uniref:Probable nicotinate-nucleotide adenylyltransferase n=1 Tax=Bacillus aquiflavi TaxID=2672567 RepID=A0A6B3W5E1_9BACI|nr:nicotinate (nicotinamide) nucleotide adenylyltransferase [Bacillus aquiflavi]MBA4538785.1 nicotinate (nicotinamide) nucleotide adenylyltransferase [Bacillus aquiflavi]NEY83136.1 nicotinate (nicotinamide) nucleotide adenylyltransferase [Bacillus aquiflavi]UAC49024.1 nicotinate (nicotinamide) nucleotide adenylyltransferase [Bacillus aquiflavi]